MNQELTSSPEEDAAMPRDATQRESAERQRAERELAAELAATNLLQRLSSQLIRDEEGNALFEQIVETAMELMGSQCGSMQRFDPHTRELRLLAWKCFHPDSAKFWQTITAESGAALQGGQRLVVPDVRMWDVCAGSRHLEHFELSGIRAIQSTPLISRGGEILGMISTYWSTVHEPAERELRFLDLLARQAADLLERSRNAEALRESETRLATVLETVPIGIGLVDTSGKLTLSNKEMQRYLPSRIIQSRDEERFRRWLAYLPDGRLAGREDFPVARALQGEMVLPGFEARYTQDDGREVWTRIAAVPFLDPEARITGAIAVIMDIDELKRSAEALRKAEERFRAVANLVPDLLWSSEPDGNTTWYNERWMDYTGQTFEEAIGWGWTETIHPEDREVSARRYRAAAEQGTALQQEHRIRRVDGEYRWFLVRAEPLFDENGRVVRMYGAAVDIHDMRHTAEALRDSQERLRLLVESALEHAIISMDAERRITSWNRGAENLFRLQP
jgi:PAS domain S-box-containing protein